MTQGTHQGDKNMDQMDIARNFIGHAEQTARMDELTSTFETALQRLGFRYYACGSHVDPLNPREALMVLNYPKSWVEDYSGLQLHRVDPVFQRASRSLIPFFWDTAEFRKSMTPSQLKMLDLARRHGVAHGYTIPIHGPMAFSLTPSSCSLIPDSVSLDERAYLAAQLMAVYLFDRASRLTGGDRSDGDAPRLSFRERQCLEFVARGKSDWSIAKLLNLSVTTVHNHIEHAKHRLCVSTRVQAVVHALGSRQIAFGDVIRPADRPRCQHGRRNMPSQGS